MADIEAPPAPTQDINKTPTLLETLASTMDLSDAPQIRGRSMPPIVEDPKKKKPEKEEPAPEEHKEEKQEDQPPKPGAEAKALKQKEEEAQLQKDSDAIADKLFKKRTPKESKQEGDKKGTAEQKPTEEKPVVKADEKKPEDKSDKSKPRRVAQAPAVDEAAITERASAAAASAATKAVSDALTKGSAQPQDKLEKGPEDKLSPEERKQFVVYKELESIDPSRYKGVTDKYLKSLDEISDYVKTWAKENPGMKFDADDEQHNAFFARVEPNVDDDDWVDAKASLRARDIAARAIAPMNERMQKMERDRARAELEPFVQHKQLEAVHQLVEYFDPEVAAMVRKPEGVKELAEKDPITAAILTSTAEMLGTLAAEVVRLHDPTAGAVYSADNAAHREIAEFILGQERRISALAPQDKERDGKMFVSRKQFQALAEDQKARYWFLSQDDVINLLAQKYAAQAKNLRDSKLEEFNKTADRLGFKKVDAPNTAPKTDPAKPKETPKAKDNPPSPEALSRATLKPTPGTPTTQNNDTASAIVGKLFGHLRSS